MARALEDSPGDSSKEAAFVKRGMTVLKALVQEFSHESGDAHFLVPVAQETLTLLEQHVGDTAQSMKILGDMLDSVAARGENVLAKNLEKAFWDLQEAVGPAGAKNVNQQEAAHLLFANAIKELRDEFQKIRDMAMALKSPTAPETALLPDADKPSPGRASLKETLRT